MCVCVCVCACGDVRVRPAHHTRGTHRPPALRGLRVCPPPTPAEEPCSESPTPTTAVPVGQKTRSAWVRGRIVRQRELYAVPVFDRTCTCPVIATTARSRAPRATPTAASARMSPRRRRRARVRRSPRSIAIA